MLKTRLFQLLVASALLSACSTAPKKSTPELSEMEGKRVALIEVKAEETQRRMIEVALVNQLMKEGSFELISKEEIEAAKKSHDVAVGDFKTLASKVNADYWMTITPLKFEANESQGYDKIIVDDSQMAVERGEAGRKVEKLVKVKQLTGNVTLEIQLVERVDGHVRSGTGEATETVRETEEKGAIHLPPKLRFLEKLTGNALADFFKKYQ